MKRSDVLFAAVVIVAALVGLVDSAAAQEQNVARFEVTVGKSRALEMSDPVTRVTVTRPDVADVFVITPTLVLISGKEVGVTSLVMFSEAGRRFFDVVVQADVTLLRDRLRELFPRDKIQVHPARETVILSGGVGDSATKDLAADVAGVFVPRGRIVNLISTIERRAQQVLLQVHVAEVAREALRELGINIRALGSTLQGGAFPGTPFVPPQGMLGAVAANTAFGRSTPDFSFDGSNFFLSSGSRDYAGLVRALAERDLLRTLAKPNLVTESGKEAKFLSGGEFPFPVPQRDGAITIQFREFGIGLVFTPMVVDGDHIHLKVAPEVSSLDFSQGLVSSGFRIPVVRKNQAFTNVALKDNESFAIAGLINNDVRQSVSKIPVLGDIPILGALFRSTRFQNNETELLFLITVKLVKPEAPGAERAADPTQLMELRPSEKEEFTLVPGVPGVGDVVDRPFGSSNLERK